MSTPPHLQASLAFRIHRLQRLLRRSFLSLAESAGFAMTPEQFFLLTKLVERDGQSQTELTDASLQDRPNLTRMLGDLEQRGWIARRPDPDDGRVRIVHLTREGQAMHDRFMAEVVVPERERLFGDLSREAIDGVLEVFTRLESRL
ncbi:MAG: MarR family transcriptional regulator [Alphaproteobacteria bacterium]|nr:MarR family transcriptional regulator [Alphaproteobacteria bacterium]